jgi:hypothetical protein
MSRRVFRPTRGVEIKSSKSRPHILSDPKKSCLAFNSATTHTVHSIQTTRNCYLPSHFLSPSPTRDLPNSSCPSPIPVQIQHRLFSSILRLPTVDVVVMLERDLPLTPTASTAHPPTKKSPAESLSKSQPDKKSRSTNTALVEDIDPSTDQQSTSPLELTRKPPLSRQLSHWQSSIDSRRSTSAAQTAVTPTLTPAPAPAPAETSTSISITSYCFHCGLRVRSAFQPNYQTCHTPLVTQEHELTSHLGPEWLGQSSKLLVEDDRSFD